ncbi:MAG: VapE domain-containing protein [Pseudomonadota bacterium]
MTDFHNEKKSAAGNGSAQQFTSPTNTNGDRVMKKDATKPETLKPLQRNAASLKPYLSTGYDLMAVVGKSPARKNWRNRQPFSADEAFQCFEDRNNVGVRLRSSDVVVDVDPRNFPKNDDAFARLQAGFALPLDAVVQTGNGGLHVYLKKPSDMKISKKLSEFPGIDFLSAGNMVVGAGSIHPKTGELYHWKSGADALCLVDHAPENLLAALTKTNQVTSSVEAGELSCEQLEEILSALDPSIYRDQTEWLNVMMARHHATNGAGIAEFIEWSTSDPKYAAAAFSIEYRWKSLRTDIANSRTVKSLYRELWKAGRGDLIPRPSPEDDFPEDLDESESLGPDLTKEGSLRNSLKTAIHVFDKELKLAVGFDVLSQRAMLGSEQMPWSENVGRIVNEDICRLCRRAALERFGVELSKDNVLEALLTLAQKARFSPVVEYLDGLTWDGTERVERLFIQYFGAEDTDYNRAVAKLFLTAAVRRARKPGTKFDTVPILEGEQGSGKSTALKTLGRDWFSDAELGRLDNKDSAIVLQGTWIFELPELTALKRSEVNTLKSFISRPADKFRAPYDRIASEYRRQFVFCGTTNNSEYLNDPTGNRRFLPVATAKIDLTALARDVDQIWAEANLIELSGASITLPTHLWAEADLRQKERLSGNWWYGKILNYLNCLPKDVTRVTSRELLEGAVGVKFGRSQQLYAKRLVATMSEFGWKYKRQLRFGGKKNGEPGFISHNDRLFTD